MSIISSASSTSTTTHHPETIHMTVTPSKRSSSPSSTVEPSVKLPKMTTGLDSAPFTQLLIKRLSDKARLPTRGSSHAAGYDLYACVSMLSGNDFHLADVVYPIRAVSKTIPARGKALVDTQLSIAVPEGTYGRVAPRSGLGM
jgi:dUTP pyrophosphatase